MITVTGVEKVSRKRKERASRFRAAFVTEPREVLTISGRRERRLVSRDAGRAVTADEK